MKTVIRSILLWLPMPLLAIINGIIRQSYLAELMSEAAARQLSTVSLLIILGIYIQLVLRKWRITNTVDAVRTGIVWFILTIAFEFSLSMGMQKKSLEETLSAYNIFQGELWVLVVLFVLAAPYIMLKVSKEGNH